MEKAIAHAKERIAASNAKPYANWNSAIRSHDRVSCHCGAILSILTEAEEPYKVTKAGDKVVHHRLSVMHCTPEYTTTRLLMDDGSAHETITCKNCANELLMGNGLEQVYCRDLAQWLAEPGGTEIVARYAYRKPLVAVKIGLREKV